MQIFVLFFVFSEFLVNMTIYYFVSYWATLFYASSNISIVIIICASINIKRLLLKTQFLDLSSFDLSFIALNCKIQSGCQVMCNSLLCSLDKKNKNTIQLL